MSITVYKENIMKEIILVAKTTFWFFNFLLRTVFIKKKKMFWIQIHCYGSDVLGERKYIY